VIVFIRLKRIKTTNQKKKGLFFIEKKMY